MNKRKKAHIVSFLCIIAAAVLCVLLFQSPIFNPGRVYNDNDLLVKENDSHHSWNSIGIPLNENTRGFSLGRFSGVNTVRIIEVVEGKTLSYFWDVTVECGKFKIILVNAQNAKIIETICEGSGKGSVNDYNLPAGEYRVKLVGDNATAEGEFSIIQN